MSHFSAWRDGGKENRESGYARVTLGHLIMISIAYHPNWLLTAALELSPSFSYNSALILLS